MIASFHPWISCIPMNHGIGNGKKQFVFSRLGMRISLKRLRALWETTSRTARTTHRVDDWYSVLAGASSGVARGAPMAYQHGWEGGGRPERNYRRRHSEPVFFGRLPKRSKNGLNVKRPEFRSRSCRFPCNKKLCFVCRRWRFVYFFIVLNGGNATTFSVVAC